MFRRADDLIDTYFSEWEHPYRTFERAVSDSIQSNGVLVDVGCGRTAPVLRKFLGRDLRLIGLDLVEFTESIDGLELHNRGITGSGLPDNSADVVMARSVMEHVTEPEAAYAEMYRILKPGGRFIFLTANAYDYASIIARVVPNRWHGAVVNRTEGREPEDVFPTAYRSNTRSQVGGLAQRTGFSVERFDYLGQYPNYFLFSRTLFRVATVYEKLLAAVPALHRFQGWLLVSLLKPSVD